LSPVTKFVSVLGLTEVKWGNWSGLGKAARQPDSLLGNLVSCNV